MLFLPPTLISVIEVLLVIVPTLFSIAYVTVAERKTMASMQRRLGPNQIGYLGLLQAFADALKLLLKEYVAPTQANIVLFFLGPVMWARVSLFIIRDKLSNYGNTLKLLVPSSIWKYVCGWSNDSCTVTSQKIFERKMGNRIAKSERSFVKVQRIYVSWCEIMVLILQFRCFLMGLERDYQVKALSNQIK